jgi:hypothetical protein
LLKKIPPLDITFHLCALLCGRLLSILEPDYTFPLVEVKEKGYDGFKSFKTVQAVQTAKRQEHNGNSA